MGYTSVPVQPDHLLQYAAFLARSLKAGSVRSYLNIIDILHKEFGLPNPLLDKWPLSHCSQVSIDPKGYIFWVWTFGLVYSSNIFI